jgi:hypothetical protein
LLLAGPALLAIGWVARTIGAEKEKEAAAQVLALTEEAV